MKLYLGDIPDKVADQISDALLDAYLSQDQNSRCGIEVVGGKGTIFITGEVSSNAKVDVEAVVYSVLRDIGYSTEYKIINNIGVQSSDIAQGVDNGGAGDQGMMFGYACRDTYELLPKAMVILQHLARYYDLLCHSDKRFLPDGKAQITGKYDDDDNLISIKDFTISYQNTEEEREKTDRILIDYVTELCAEYEIYNIQNFHINPTGKFKIGGFDADAGLTGRKLGIDNYQSFAKVGFGAFSGKDATKVDRSGAYKARQVAVQYLMSHADTKWCKVQISYAIGIKRPLAIYIETDKGKVRGSLEWLYEECTPENIIKDLNLKHVIYRDTASFGHFGCTAFPWEWPSY